MYLTKLLSASTFAAKHLNYQNYISAKYVNDWSTESANTFVADHVNYQNYICCSICR